MEHLAEASQLHGATETTEEWEGTTDKADKGSAGWFRSLCRLSTYLFYPRSLFPCQSIRWGRIERAVPSTMGWRIANDGWFTGRREE